MPGIFFRATGVVTYNIMNKDKASYYLARCFLERIIRKWKFIQSRYNVRYLFITFRNNKLVELGLKKFENNFQRLIIVMKFTHGNLNTNIILNHVSIQGILISGPHSNHLRLWPSYFLGVRLLFLGCTSVYNDFLFPNHFYNWYKDM